MRRDKTYLVGPEAARERFAGNINYGLKLFAQRYNIRRYDRKKVTVRVLRNEKYTFKDLYLKPYI